MNEWVLVTVLADVLVSSGAMVRGCCERGRCDGRLVDALWVACSGCIWSDVVSGDVGGFGVCGGGVGVCRPGRAVVRMW